MANMALYPLRFDPIYQYRLWGGRRLANWLKGPLPGDGPIGEAWLLSDRNDHPSRVMDGPLQGRTMTELMQTFPSPMLGKLSGSARRFPLLLKLLDVQKMLSVQVHPADQNQDLIPEGETGKSEAWVVLDAAPASRIYAGLKPGTTIAALRALSLETVDGNLPSMTPRIGDAVHIKAGAVHSLGDGVVVFEVQENSDITFRLYDWDHIDPTSGKRRDLQVEQALACIDLSQGPILPTAPIIETAQPYLREQLVVDPHFRLCRVQSAVPFSVGAGDEPRVLFCIAGQGYIHYRGTDYTIEKGDVVLLPAAVGVCRLRPEGAVTIVDIAMPVQP